MISDMQWRILLLALFLATFGATLGILLAIRTATPSGSPQEARFLQWETCILNNGPHDATMRLRTIARLLGDGRKPSGNLTIVQPRDLRE